MKFLIYKDYLTGRHHLGYDYEMIDVKDQFDAVCKAEEIWNAEADRLYLMRIMSKVGKIEKREDGWKAQKYEAVLCKRSCEVGWHHNDSEHSEGNHTETRVYKKDLEYFA